MVTPLRILIVDELAACGSDTARLLRRYGYSVTTATSALEVSGLSQQQFDCGVFGCVLPDGDGIQVASRLLRAETIRRAVFFCAMDDAETTARAQTIGSCVDRSYGIRELERVISGRAARSRSGVLRMSLDEAVDDSQKTGSR